MKIRFPIVVELNDVLEKTIEQLRDVFSISLPFFQEEIIQNLRNKNIEDALKNIDNLRRSISEMDYNLENYYGILMEYQKIVLQTLDKKEKEGDDNHSE